MNDKIIEIHNRDAGRVVSEIVRLRETLALISRMKLFPDDKANRTTLSAATGLARQALGDAPGAS